MRKSGSRAVLSDAPGMHERDERAWTDERAERYERLRVGAEAMASLKPHEIRCLLLKAEGLSYQEICSATGFSYTKVNRCITEGRRAFLKRVAGIEAGAECERLAPVISKVADGEATPDEVRLVRPHLKGCLACKATLREYRETPARLAGLVPPVVAIAGGDRAGFLARMLAALHDRAGSAGEVAGAKAAVVASAVVLAGGGAAGVEALHHDAPRVAPSAYATEPDRTPASPAAATPATPASTPAAPDPVAPEAAVFASEPATASTEPAQSTATPEFDPGTAASAPAATKRASKVRATDDAPARRTDSGPPAAGGEFGP